MLQLAKLKNPAKNSHDGKTIIGSFWYGVALTFNPVLPNLDRRYWFKCRYLTCNIWLPFGINCCSYNPLSIHYVYIYKGIEMKSGVMTDTGLGHLMWSYSLSNMLFAFEKGSIWLRVFSPSPSQLERKHTCWFFVLTILIFIFYFFYFLAFLTPICFANFPWCYCW